MASMTLDPWKKSASFGTLANNVGSLVEAYSVADVISLVSSEMPIDTRSTFQESQGISKLIVDSILNITVLDPFAWVTSEGHEVKIPDPDDLKTRPADIQYICFRCQMHGSSVDT